jgi:lipoprotein NlpD
MKVTVVILIVLLTSCSRHHPAPVTDVSRYHNKSSKAKSTKREIHRKYITVKKGDTLYSIGFGYDIDYKKLAQINGISPPYRIYPGQKLRLKQRKPTTRSNSVKTNPLVVSNKITAKPTNNSSKKPIKKPVVIKNKPVSKPVNKPTKKPTHNPVINQSGPYSNSRWIWPVKGSVISSFSQSDVSRKGIDIASPIGKPVYASNNGTVVYSGDGLRGYGELIIVKHANNLLSAYAHNSSRLVKEGDLVKQGQQIAKSGKGTDGKGLLHFEIRKNGKPVNPIKYLPNK